MTGKLAALYQTCEGDSQLLSIRSEVAIVGARIHELVDRLNGGTGESGAAWAQLQSAWADLQQANRTKNIEAAQQAIRVIGEIVASGSAEELQWREVLALLDRKASLAAKEHARQRDLAGFLPIGDAMMLAVALGEVVRARITDQAIVRQIALDIERIIHSGPIGATAITASRLGSAEPGIGGDVLDADAVAVVPAPATAVLDSPTVNGPSLEHSAENNDSHDGVAL